MRCSIQWLAELVEGLPDADELARRLTLGGLEVEAIHRPVMAYGDRLVVARIAEKEQHPNADRLTVCRVDDGSGVHTIVCGAKNHSAGDTVVLARPGCTLPGGLTIRKSKLRGVDSEGMLCSATELGLEAEYDGILLLEQGIAPGTLAAPLLGLDDTILELGITPNRGDCLSMLGIAREVAALLGRRLREPAAATPAGSGASAASVEIRDTDGCPLYHGLVLRGAKIAPSPTWLRTRLAAAGLRPINNVVDVTNYVLMELGQPLHAFDLAKLEGGRVVVRRAEAGEKIRTLDKSDVELRGDDLVIADARRPVAIAGVMGGEETAVDEGTTDLFLESAWFAPATVRRTSRRHGIVSDSSYRFERGVDAAGVERALLRAAALLAEVAGARAEGAVLREGPGAPPPAAVRVRPARVRTVLGTDVSDETIVKTLEAVGAARKGGDSWLAPSWRPDIAREIDFVEEVARIVGYGDIAPAMPLAPLVPVAVPAAVEAASRVRTLLADLGLHEHVSVSFTSEASNARFPGLLDEAASVLVRNPLRSDATALQRSALGALLSALQTNVAVQQPRVDLFTIARGFAMRSESEPVQKEIVAGLLYGPRPEAQPGRTRAVSFADLRAVVEKVCAVLAPATPFALAPLAGRPELHPRAAAEVRVDGKAVGIAGRLHPDVAEGAEITGEIYVFEIDCRKAGGYRRAHPGLQPIPRYPGSERDVSLLVRVELPAAAAIDAVAELGEPAIESVTVFDEYKGAAVGEGRKALGYRIVYRAADRTLTDAEVTALHDRVLSHLTGRLGAEVRA